MNDVNERLLKAKADSGYSYADLEKLTGIPRSTLQRCFTGDTEKFPLDIIMPVCNALHLDAVELMGWTSPVVVSATMPADGLVLSDEEKLLVLKYRDAPRVIQEAIMRMLS